MPNLKKTTNVDIDENKHSVEVMNILQNGTVPCSIESLEDLQNLAAKILKEMDNLKIKFTGTTKIGLAFLYTTTYILATINLLGVARSINFSDPLNALRELSLVGGASLAPGLMYLGGMQDLVEMAGHYFETTDNHPIELSKKIKNFFSKMSGTDYLKMTPILILAGFSTILDATNAKKGIEAIAGNTAGTIAGIGNGIAEGILPAFTLKRLFCSIFNDSKRAALGAGYTHKELGLAISNIKKFMPPMVSPDQPSSISDLFQNTSSEERLEIKELMERIQNSGQFAAHLFDRISGKDPKLSNSKIKITATSRILATLILSYLSALALSRVFSAGQIVTHYKTEFSRYNLTLNDIHLYPAIKNETAIDIKPFSDCANAFNQLSYAIQGVAFLPLIKQTILGVKNPFKFISNPQYRKRVNLKKAGFAAGIAGIGTFCYFLLGLGAKEDYKTLQSLLQIEELQVPQIPFFPDFSLLPYIALLLLVGILYGGASNAAKKIFDSVPESLCFRKTTAIDVNGQHSFPCNFFSQPQSLAPEATTVEPQVLKKN